jgi:AcrR family transcriptional regulator
MVTKRDPASTRARILTAALDEFAAAGRAGARVDRIAARSGVNKRMIYHYFGNKDGLYAALLERRLSGLEATLGDWLDGRATDDPDHVRLLMWEALESGRGPVVREDDRSVAWQRLVDEVRALPGDARADAHHVALAVVAIVLFPVAFPQIARMIAGAAADEVSARRALLGALLEPTRATKPRYRLAPRVT